MAAGDRDSPEAQILALSGGVGGAKLALGLSHCLAPSQLSIVANTGDDFVHMGLKVSPDIDTLVYTLAGLANPETGWGRVDEGRRFMDAVAELGGEDWFFLGDKDLAMHVLRSQRLAAGDSLSSVTDAMRRQLGIGPRIIPMSDLDVPTLVETNEGTLGFQEYFVGRQCEPEITGFRFENADRTPPAPAFDRILRDGGLSAVIICPSNPFISIDPIFALAGIRDRIRQRSVPVVAVSPVIGGAAVKGPTAKMMRELKQPVNNQSIAQHYAGLIDGLVIDRQDESDIGPVEAAGIQCRSTNTLMRSLDDRINLAETVLAFAGDLAKPT